jgi:hypothetical protein
MFEHLFLLFVFVGAERTLDSRDMYFRNLNDCIWFSEKIHKQGETITSYCLPKLVNSDSVKVY